MDKLIVDFPGDERRQYFHDGKGRLIFKAGHTTKAVMENITGDFDGAFDSAGSLYIVAANPDGGIDCLISGREGEKIVPLVTGKSGVSNISGIRVFFLNGIFSLWYCLEYESRLLLVNQLFDSGARAQAPFALDSIAGRKTLSVCCDGNCDTNVFYKDKDGKSRCLRHLHKTGSYEPAGESLFDYEDVVSISSICDENKTHLVFVARRRDYYGIYYKNTASPQEIVLGFGVGAGCTTSVSSEGKTVRVCWKDNYESCRCLSTDGGKTFAKPVRIGTPGDRISLCGYRSSTNPSVMFASDCICLGDGERLMYENEIPSHNNPSGTNAVDSEDEIKAFAKEAASETKVSLDIASRLESIEILLMKIAYMLEVAMDETKKEFAVHNGGNDIEAV